MPFAGEPPTFAPKLGLMPWLKLKCHKRLQFSNLYVPKLLHDLSWILGKGSKQLQWGLYDVNQVLQDTYSILFMYVYILWKQGWHPGQHRWSNHWLTCRAGFIQSCRPNALGWLKRPPLWKGRNACRPSRLQCLFGGCWFQTGSGATTPGDIWFLVGDLGGWLTCLLGGPQKQPHWP